MITLEATEGLNRRNFDDHGDHDFAGTCEQGSKFLATVDDHALMSQLLGGLIIHQRGICHMDWMMTWISAAVTVTITITNNEEESISSNTAEQ